MKFRSSRAIYCAFAATAISTALVLPSSADPLRFSPIPPMQFSGFADTLSVNHSPTRQLLGKPTAAKPLPKYQTWMSSEIADAWTAGFKGQGTTITVVDDFTSKNYLSGNLGNGVQSQRHGEWTRLEASMIAPSAAIASKDFNSGTRVALAAKGLNVLNLSYGMYASSQNSLSQITWSAQETSIIDYAKNGRAVIAKAAGNDAVAVGAVNSAQNIDFLDQALVGTQSALFVGALSSNGTTATPATLAYYSNYAGTDVNVQSHFLVVGVEGSKTGLYGTSFAAPIITGYAAALGSKFTAATPTQITNQLLSTARKDTIAGYDVTKYGQGEASITRALAPAAIK